MFMMCFLLAIASTKRLTELHDLLFEMGHSRGWASCTFLFVHGFVAKIQTPAVPDIPFQEFTVLKEIHRWDREEMVCCPKALTEQDRTISPDCSHLFISVENVKRISKNTIFFWLRVAISESYRTAFDGDCMAVKVEAHKMHSSEASKFSKENFVVEQIIRVEMWTTQSTFTSFYRQMRLTIEEWS